MSGSVDYFGVIVGAVIGGVIGFASGFFSTVLLQWWYRPKADIKSDSFKKESKPEPETSKGKFIRYSMRIHNSGRTAAKNCQVLLTLSVDGDLEKVRDYLLAHTQHFKPLVGGIAGNPHVTKESFRPIKDTNLCWATGDMNTLLLPNIDGLFDLCILYASHDRNEKYILLPSENGFERPRAILVADTKYDVTIKVGTENMKHDPKKHAKNYNLSFDAEANRLRLREL